MDGSTTTNLLDSPYTSLDPAQRDIRLLELIPGDHDSDLVLNLHVHSLEDREVRYTTLSYVWGKEPCPRPALVNGKQVAIGRNLDCALRHIRGNTADLLGSTLFWIDALCIDQADLEERNHQVGLMGQIYSSADDMVIWLGPERPDTAFILERIRGGELPEGIDVLPVLKALKRLCRRPWFGRLWIAQELVLSRDPEILVGHQSLRWQLFHEFVRKMLVKVKTVDIESEEWPVFPRIYFVIAAERVTKLHSIKQIYGCPLLIQLVQTTALLASDPRDKVYGLLNLCKSASAPVKISPDYTKSVQRVFAEATVAMLLNGSCAYTVLPLQPLLNDVPRGKAFVNRIVDLPSWVLDLTIGTKGPFLIRGLPCQPMRFRNIEGDQYLVPVKLAPKLLPHIKVDDQFLRLSVIGNDLGTIIETSGSMFDKREISGSVSPKDVYDAYLKINRAREISTEVFMQAVSGGDGRLGPGSVEVATQAQLLHDTIGPNDEYLPRDEDILCASMAIHGCKNTVVFVTAEGHVGRTYHPEFGNGIRAGDVIVGLFGVNYPCILRKVPPEDGQKSVYTMVNIAYIANHKLGHDFVKSAPDDADLAYFQQHGLQNYTIV